MVIAKCRAGRSHWLSSPVAGEPPVAASPDKWFPGECLQNRPRNSRPTRVGTIRLPAQFSLFKQASGLVHGGRRGAENGPSRWPNKAACRCTSSWLFAYTRPGDRLRTILRTSPVRSEQRRRSRSAANSLFSMGGRRSTVDSILRSRRSLPSNQRCIACRRIIRSAMQRSQDRHWRDVRNCRNAKPGTAATLTDPFESKDSHPYVSVQDTRSLKAPEYGCGRP